mmetsp:Transcript_3470/g.5987  ORF Transcript_3470/g.5987 Transcript_3470/m.5987 type:complete len:230 (+) Transcript_3470:1124-1813(+)
MNSLKLIGFVQNNVQLVVHSPQSIGQDGQRLSRGSWFVRVEEQQDHVRALGVPLDHFFKVVAAVHGVILRPAYPALVSAAHGAVDHAWAVHNHEVIHCSVAAHLQLGVVDQRGPEALQSREAHVWVSNERRAIPVHVSGTGCDDREGVVRGRHSSGLHAAVQDVIHERRFARRVIPQQEHKRKYGVLVGGLVEGSTHALVEVLHTLQELLTVQHDARTLAHRAKTAHRD